jgi:NADH:ubiquinone oxidoreductase subunit 2 (subunit N)
VLLPAWHAAGPTLTVIVTLCGVLGALYYLKPLPDLLAGLRSERSLEDLSASLLSRTAVTALGVVVALFAILPYLATRIASAAR